MGLHHVALAVGDLEESLRFYREGLGGVVVLDEVFERDWQRLVGTPATRMRAVVVVPTDGRPGAIELIAFEDEVERPAPPAPPRGLFLLSFEVDDVEATRQRLAGLGYGPFEEDHSEVGGTRVDVTFLRDPDGVVVELVSAGQSAAAMPDIAG